MQLTTFLLPLFPVLAYAQATWQSGVLNEHNKYRKIHQAANLTWSTSIASVAQTHVSSCNFALYTGSGGYGQNLAAGSFSPVSGAVDYWYQTSANYNYSDPGFSQDTGTFTQVVWKSSTQLGCGVQACNGLNNVPGSFIACFYLPAGNVEGEFQTNVLPATSSATTTTSGTAAHAPVVKVATQRKMLAAQVD